MNREKINDLVKKINSGKIKVAVFDLDRTIWDHEDVTSMKPPFKKIENGKIVDTTGDMINLYPCMEDFLKCLREKGLKIATASWNVYDKAYQALEALDLTKYFDYFVIEFHPRKEEMIEKIMKKFNVSEEEIIFFDDNPKIVERVLKVHKKLNIVHIGTDIVNICDFYKLLC